MAPILASDTLHIRHKVNVFLVLSMTSKHETLPAQKRLCDKGKCLRHGSCEPSSH